MTDDNRTLAVIAGITMLAGPRRTRPLAGFAYGLFLSRAHGAGLRRLEGVVHDVFEQRKSVTARVELAHGRIDAGAVDFGQRLGEIAERVERLEGQRLRIVDGGQS